VPTSSSGRPSCNPLRTCRRSRVRPFTGAMPYVYSIRYRNTNAQRVITMLHTAESKGIQQISLRRKTGFLYTGSGVTVLVPSIDMRLLIVRHQLKHPHLTRCFSAPNQKLPSRFQAPRLWRFVGPNGLFVPGPWGRPNRQVRMPARCGGGISRGSLASTNASNEMSWLVGTAIGFSFLWVHLIPVEYTARGVLVLLLRRNS